MKSAKHRALSTEDRGLRNPRLRLSELISRPSSRAPTLIPITPPGVLPTQAGVDDTATSAALGNRRPGAAEATGGPGDKFGAAHQVPAPLVGPRRRRVHTPSCGQVPARAVILGGAAIISASEDGQMAHHVLSHHHDVRPRWDGSFIGPYGHAELCAAKKRTGFHGRIILRTLALAPL